MSQLIPPHKPLQRVMSLSEDVTVMTQKQRMAYLVKEAQEAFSEYEGGVRGYILNQMHGSIPQQIAVLGLFGKLVAPAIAEKTDEMEKVVRDIPWLTRNRLSYKDPDRAAECAQDAEFVMVREA